MFTADPHAKFSNIVLLFLSATLLQGCSPKIDARQVHVEQGLIYKKDANDPFTGTLINVGPNEVGREYGAQFLPFEGNCTVPVKDGMFEGVAICKNSKGEKIAEVTYSRGHQDGSLKVWAPETGNLMTSMVVHNRAIDGLFERYNPKSGKIISRTAYSSGKKSGEEKLWDTTGETLLTDLNWQDGAETGVYRNGPREEHYKAGKRDGVWKMCQVNRSIAPEKLQAIYAKANAYDSLVENMGGTYFLAALVDSPTDVECVETVYIDGVEQNKTPSSSGERSSEEACLDAKVAAFHKENGEDALIVNDVMKEWNTECHK